MSDTSCWPAEWLRPDWPVGPRVRAFVTTRSGGCSGGPYGLSGGIAGGLNLGSHTGDDPDAVARNRARLPMQPVWLEQVHGTDVVCADAAHEGGPPRADAAYATQPGRACVVLTADCLPVFVADRVGRVVGVAHAGWRGLAAGVIERLVDVMRERVPEADLVAWLGPCIGPSVFEVGPEVRTVFLSRDAGAAGAFAYGAGDRWLADLPALARRRLASRGMAAVGGGGHCTVTDATRFYSYRRDGTTGRFASAIWIDPSVA